MKNLGMFVLFAALALTTTSLFLSPAYPATAFYQQYYETRFRVRGLIHPTFTFENLPKFFTGSEDGVLSGTPDITGTFRITIKYAEGDQSGESQVVISVTASPNTEESEKQSAEVVYLVIETALSTWIYRSGDNINIELIAKHGVAPLTWSFANLPQGLFADNSGKISGKITEAGLYSFSASCGDANGNKAESYYTLNIQPGTLIKTNNIIDVPDRNVPLLYDLEQVRDQQIAADKAVTNALAVVAQARALVKAKQAANAKAQASVNFAASQEKAAQATFTQAQNVFNHAENEEHRAEAVLNTAKNFFAVAETAFKQAEAVLATARKQLAAAQKVWDEANAAFEAATAAEIAARNALHQAQADYDAAVAAHTAAQNAHNIAWNNLQAAKAVLDDANNKLLDAKAKTANAQNALELATQDNDDAQTNLNVADAALTAAQHALEDANAKVGELRIIYNKASESLGAAKYDYTQALNRLFVAQSAKEASDKAIAIAFAQGAASMDLLEGESTYVFEGCLSLVHPAISGTVQVTNLIPSGAQLSSGHILAWGECTTKETINIGDIVYYEGTILSNCISASKITVVQL